MIILKPEINYNKDSKILSIRLSRKRSVDYDDKGSIVNIDIMEINFSEFEKIRKLPFSKRLAGVFNV